MHNDPQRKCMTSNIRTPLVRVYLNHSFICFVVMLRNGGSPYNFEKIKQSFQITADIFDVVHYEKIKRFKHRKKE